MPKFICVEPAAHSMYRAVEVVASAKAEARKAMCKGCISSCSGPVKTLEILDGQLPLF